MNSWTGDVEETDEPEESKQEGFASTLQSHVDDGVVSDLAESELVRGLEEIEDESLLTQAYRQLEGNGHPEKTNLVRNQLEKVGEVPEGNVESNLGTSESSEDSSDSWGGTPVEDAEELDEEVDSEAAEPSIESVDEMEDESLGGDEEIQESQSSALSEDSGGAPEPASAIGVDEMAERDRRWKMMVWGPPGLFKSHFAYTAPEPVAYIDTERKAQDIAHKFSDREIQIWQPQGFRETQDALKEAMEWLDWWREEKGETGTIVIDSISLAWEWAKTAYKTEAYPMTDNEEVTLSSNMGNSQDSDWQHIKGMHNSEFREWITDSPYHFVWTAMQKEDYNAVMSGEADGKPPMIPEGEKNNVHKADTIIRARKDDKGRKVGDMVKSNFTDHLFMELERPTFPKLRDTVEAIESAESSDDEVDKSALEDDLGVRIIRGDPSQYDE